MADEELRALERALAREDTPALRVRYARGLVEAGRAEDALDALLPARDHPQARAALARLPAWTHVRADAGGSAALDVPLLRERPVLRWETALDGRAWPITGLLASPLGVVLLTQDDGGLEAGHVWVLDPVTGQRRWWLSRLAHPPAAVVVGERLLLGDRSRVRCLALGSGAQLAATPEPGELACAASDLALVHDSGPGTRLWPYRWRVAGPELRLDSAWPDEGALAPALHRCDLARLVGERLLLVHGAASGERLGLAAAHLPAGRLEWEVELDAWRARFLVLAADARGLVVDPRGQLACYDLDGRPLWRVPEDAHATPLALGPAAVLATGRAGAGPPLYPPAEGPSVLLLDRATGAVRGAVALAGLAPQGVLRAFAAARDGVYLAIGGPRGDLLVACDLDGAVLWQEPLPGARSLALLPGRLLVSGERVVRCYGRPAAAQ